MASIDLPSLEYAAIKELAELRQWVCWKTVIRTDRSGAEKPTKVPINPATGRKALVNVEHTWGSFRQACQHWINGDDIAGVGFVITGSGEYTGIDIDHCIDRAKATVTKEATDLIASMNSYTELSPSGTGYHILVRGKPPGKSRQSAFGGIYANDRYFTVTGQHLKGTPEVINFREAQLGRAYYNLFDSSRRTQSADPTPAAIATDPRYEKLIDDLNPFCRADVVAPEKIGVLFENNREAGRLWMRERIKPEEGSWSQSEYDLALANHFLDADWLPVEVMRALIENRRKFGAQLKLRPDYYARTLVAAQRGRERSKAIKALQDAGDLPPEQIIAGSLEALSVTFGCVIKRIVKFIGDPPSYRIVTDKGATSGDISMLSSQNAFRQALMESCGHVAPTVKAKEWATTLQAILNAIEEDYAGDEMTDRGQMNAWLEAYLDYSPKAIEMSNGHAFEAVSAGNPFIASSILRIVSSDLLKFLRRNMGTFVSTKKVGTMLRDVGAAPEVYVFSSSEGRRTSRAVWKLPQSYLWMEKDKIDADKSAKGPPAGGGQAAPPKQPDKPVANKQP